MVEIGRDTLEDLSIIDRKTVLKKIPLSRAAIHRLEVAGLFPRALQLSPNKVGYRLTEIESWLRNRPLAIRNRSISAWKGN